MGIFIVKDKENETKNRWPSADDLSRDSKTPVVVRSSPPCLHSHASNNNAKDRNYFDHRVEILTDISP